VVNTLTKNPFELWMLKPAIIKRLQVFLALSLILNCLFIHQIINKKITSIKTKKTITKIENTFNENKLKNFLNEYFKNFFGNTQENLDFIKMKTDSELFETSIKKEIETRIKKNILSKFEITDIYVEELESGLARGFIAGIEIFNDQKYLNRNYLIEILIDIKTQKIIKIPKFEIK